MEIRWKVKFKEQNIPDKTGMVVTDSEISRIISYLPEATIDEVIAEIDVQVENNERIFMNGYQTWTYSPELTKKDRLRGLNGISPAIINRYHFDRYGDYHFMNYSMKKGMLHGESYGYFRCEDHYRLFASLDEMPGYTIFIYDAGKGKLIIKRDCSGIKVNGNYHLFDLFFKEGSENEVFDAWFEAMNIKTITDNKICGYSSWYNRYQDINEEAILEDLDGCAKFFQKGDLFQIDDGWEPFVGDWLECDAVKFPGGMKNQVELIHEKGFKAGLWLAPFVAQTGSKLISEHPDWLLKINDKPWICGSNWGGFYSLDIDNPEVIEYLERVFDKVLNEWGFDLVKLDFLYGGAPFGDEHETRAAKMIKGMKLLRRLCGTKQILGCGVPVMPAFGLVEYCRTSCDVTLDWNDVAYMRLFHRERNSTKQAIENNIFRRELNNRAFISDPDVFFLRNENLKLSDSDKYALATLDALLGGVFLTSDDPGTYTDRMKKDYQYFRNLTNAVNIKVENLNNGIDIEFSLNNTIMRYKYFFK